MTTYTKFSRKLGKRQRKQKKRYNRKVGKYLKKRKTGQRSIFGG